MPQKEPFDLSMAGSRQPAPSGSSSTSASSPRKAPSFFGLRRYTSKGNPDRFDRIHEVSRALLYSPCMINQTTQPWGDGEKIVSSSFFIPAESTTRRSDWSIPSPDPFLFASHDKESRDKEYLRLLENTKRIRTVPQEPKKIDNAWEVYEKSRNECYQICRSLINKSRKFAPKYDL
jgi:hypothetical protein